VLHGSIAVLALVALIGAGGAAWGLWSFNQIERVDLRLAESGDAEPQNYLLIGSDSREGLDPNQPGAAVMLGAGKEAPPPGRRSDSIVIVRIDPDLDRIDMLSLPRDLWVPIAPDWREQRLNSAYAASTQNLVDTIERDFALPIHHTIEVDFRGFQDLISTVGGVPLWFDHPVRDPNSGLDVRSAGCTRLDGFQGLAFARARYLQWHNGDRWISDPTGDVGRMTRQHLMARAVAQRVQSMGINDVRSIKGLVDAAVGNVTLDSGLGAGELIGLGRRFSSFDPGAIQTYSLPTTDHTTSGGAMVQLLDAEAAQPILDIFRGTSAPTTTTTTAPPPKPGGVTVDVLNSGPKDGEARRVAFVLGEGGFTVGVVESAPSDDARTLVLHAPGAAATGALVASWLSPDPLLVEDPAVPPGVVRITIGDDPVKVSKPPATTTTTTTTTTMPIEPGAVAPMAPPTIPETEGGWTPGVPPPGVVCA
jgi:polyisoprenyl-teichoic acid--peptidoglycan teichoic acid transferase